MPKKPSPLNPPPDPSAIVTQTESKDPLVLITDMVAKLEMRLEALEQTPRTRFNVPEDTYQARIRELIERNAALKSELGERNLELINLGKRYNEIQTMYRANVRELNATQERLLIVERKLRGQILDEVFTPLKGSKGPAPETLKQMEKFSEDLQDHPQPVVPTPIRSPGPAASPVPNSPQSVSHSAESPRRVPAPELQTQRSTRSPVDSQQKAGSVEVERRILGTPRTAAAAQSKRTYGAGDISPDPASTPTPSEESAAPPAQAAEQG